MLDLSRTLPDDGMRGALVGRVWRPDLGPSVGAVRPDGAWRAAGGERLAGLADILANTAPESRDPRRPWLLAPIDLQVIKAAGVTFAVSMLERVIEERARGNPSAAAAIRAEIQKLVGDDLKRLRPGSPEAMRLK